ncbi:DUF2330 domain-containing protein [Akkermansiaceae bacterium]|nr:DUF2330 domain-containing protein [Akkermansiaceae bacterium]
MKPAAVVCMLLASSPMPGQGCCAVAGMLNHVLNADQTVIMVWDKKRQTQHFIRKADFRTDADEIGFLVPSPSRPQLDESGNGAFSELAAITAPKASHGGGFPLGCSAAPQAITLQSRVTVIEEKRVAGFDATVLTARSGDDLVEWLRKNGYAYSPAVADWARPYLGGDWHFTALKVAKNNRGNDEVKAAALRISFRTDRPLFPYREPDSMAATGNLDAKNRLLRIYFIADTQYEGKIGGNRPWTGKTKWSGRITQHRQSLLDKLNLPESSGPSEWWLTEIEDRWPYRKAAGDVYFSPVARPRTIAGNDARNRSHTDASAIAMLACFVWVIGLRKRG